MLLGSSWMLCSCIIWLPSIARLLHYFVWLLHYLTQLAKYQFDFQLLLALFNTSIAHLLLTLFTPWSFCVGVSLGFKLDCVCVFLNFMLFNIMRVCLLV
jgi:hypothetical protein